jgi:hypothetical protein
MPEHFTEGLIELKNTPITVQKQYTYLQNIIICVTIIGPPIIWCLHYKENSVNSYLHKMQVFPVDQPFAIIQSNKAEGHHHSGERYGPFCTYIISCRQFLNTVWLWVDIVGDCIHWLNLYTFNLLDIVIWLFACIALFRVVEVTNTCTRQQCSYVRFNMNLSFFFKQRKKNWF